MSDHSELSEDVDLKVDTNEKEADTPTRVAQSPRSL